MRNYRNRLTILYIAEHVSGRRYVGITAKKLIERVNQHLGDGSRYLHGTQKRCTYFDQRLAEQPDGWVFDVLFYYNNRKDAEHAERELIHHLRLNDLARGYNRAEGGGRGPLGSKHTASAKAKISAAHKGRKATESVRHTLRESWTPERRENQSRKQRASWTPERRAALAERNRTRVNKPLTPEQLQRRNAAIAAAFRKRKLKSAAPLAISPKQEYNGT
jgi:hypothetical protein